MLLRHALSVLVLSSFLSDIVLAKAQVATGSYPLGTYDSLGADVINVGNLNVMLNVPVLHKAGRAGTNFTYDLFYNSSIWTPSGGTWVPDSYWGWSVDTQPLTGYLTERSQGPTSCIPHAHSSIEIIVSGVTYHDRFGVQHGWRGQRTEDMCTGATTDTLSNTWSTDNLYYYGPSGITDAKGVLINAPVNTSSGVASFTDTNGNIISTDGNGNFTDTTGNIVLTIGGAAPSNKLFTYKDGNGTPQTVTLAYSNYAIATNFGCTGLAEYSRSSASLISAITLPDGSSYNFTYEHAPGTASGSVTGRLATVQLPTTGIVSYSYPGPNGGINCGDGSAIGLVRTQVSTPGSPTRTYTRTSSGASLSHTSVSDEQNNDTEYDFVQAATSSQSPTNYYETARTVYQGNGGTALLAKQTCYNASAVPCNYQTLTAPISQIDTYDTLDGVTQSGTTTTYDSFLDTTSTVVHDFGSATTRGGILQTTSTPYTNGYITSNSTLDSAGNLVAATYYGYGAGTVSTSGVPSFTARYGGMNLVTTDRYYLVGGGPGYYRQTNTYYNTGSLYQATGALGPAASEPLTVNYDSTNTFPTTTTQPSPTGATLTTGTTTDLTSGIPLTSTSINGAITTYASFDPFGRPQTGVVTFRGSTLGKFTRTYQPNHVQTLTYQSQSLSTEADTYYDAYGRTIRTATQASASPTSFYIVDTCYDTLGRQHFRSYPYSAVSTTGSSICSGLGDTYTYDALGRILHIGHADSGNTSVTYAYTGSATQVTDENGISHIYQVDGLGRITVVCEISSNSSMPNSGAPTSCGTLIPGSGFITAYSYLNNVTTMKQGAQTRTFAYDGLGRLVSKSESELSASSPSGAATTYGYTVNTAGLAVIKTSPQANQTNPAITTTTTYQYDLLGRLSSVTYSDGVTPTKTFTYDQALSGSAFNTGESLGLMTAASNAASTTQFSYDPQGRLNGTSQCLPGMCGTIPTVATRGYGYDWQGNKVNEQYSTPSGLVGLNFGVNLAGQVVSVTGGQDSTIASSLYSVPTANFSPYGPTGVNYGNGLTATMSYDVFGHPAGLGLFLPTTPLYAWTANWSGNRVSASQDSTNAGSATYTYDDMNRLSGAAMGANFNLTWVYDRYGNRWSQSATGNWRGTVIQPSLSFNSANNQIVTAGFAYDAAGNVKQDALHTYTYDADGNVTAVDGGVTASYQYDALNRRVQIVAPNGTQEFDFNAAGQRATVWDASGHLVSAQYYAGTQPIAYYLASNAHVRFRHQDWTGTERFRTTYNGNIEGAFGSLPFGDGLTTIARSDTDTAHFTGLDQDTTNIEHATYRELSSAQGQWLSPDPYLGSYNPKDPQTFNRYSYVLNSPVSYTDPDGEDSTGPGLCYLTASNCGAGGGGGGVGIGGDGLGQLQLFYNSSNAGYTGVSSFNGTYYYAGESLYSDLAGNPGAGITVLNDGTFWAGGGYQGTLFTGDLGGVLLSSMPTGNVTSSNGGGTAISPTTDPSLQLAQALGKTGVYSLNSPCFVPAFYGASAVGGALALYGTGMTTIYELGYVIGWGSGAVTTTQTATAGVNKVTGAQPGDAAYQSTPLDVSQQFGHACLGTTGH